MPKSAFSIIHRVALEWRQWDGKKKGRWSHESSIELRRKLPIQLFHPAGYTLVTPRAGTQNWCCVGSGQLEHGWQQWTPCPSCHCWPERWIPCPRCQCWRVGECELLCSCLAVIHIHGNAGTGLKMGLAGSPAHLSGLHTAPAMLFWQLENLCCCFFFPFLFSWLLPWLSVHKKLLYFSAAWVNPKNVDRCVVFVK